MANYIPRHGMHGNEEFPFVILGKKGYPYGYEIFDGAQTLADATAYVAELTALPEYAEWRFMVRLWDSARVEWVRGFFRKDDGLIYRGVQFPTPQIEMPHPAIC